MKKVTLKRLATELNLSPSTISRSLRNSHEISEQTKERVRALAAALDFQPNPHASSLRKNKSKTIAVVVPEIQNNFFSQVMSGVEEVARQKGYNILVYLTHEDHQRESEIARLLRNGRVEGVMISVASTTAQFSHLETLKNENVPLVFFDRICDEFDLPCITADDTAISSQATEHLIEEGCKKIALLSMPVNLSISTTRRAGYQQALKNHGMSSSELIVECDQDDDSNREKIRQLLQGPDRPDGIFAAVEKFAINTYEVCRELGIQIPQQLKIVSFSNLPAIALFDPPLSAIVQPAYEIGRESMDALCKLIDHKKIFPPEQRIVLPCRLEIRNSSTLNKEKHYKPNKDFVLR